jgi:hypothetical protein
MMARARSGLTPGISASRSAAGSTGPPAPGLARGPGALGVDALCGRDGVQGRGDAVLDRGDGPVQERDVVQVDPGEPAVVVSVEHALQRRLDARAPGPDLSCGQAGQDAGVALAAGERFQDGSGRLDLLSQRGRSGNAEKAGQLGLEFQ